MPLAAAFALMFGAANGLVTITRGALPLALFGADGYGRLMGRISGFWLVMQSAAPLVMAFVAERASDATALALAAGICRRRAGLLCRDQAPDSGLTAQRAAEHAVDVVLRGVAAVVGELRAVEEAAVVLGLRRRARPA